jgi:leucyl aminopeptidase
MTDFADLLVADRGQPAQSIIRITKAGFDAWLKSQPAPVRVAATAARFEGKPESHLILPADNGKDWSVVIGVEESEADPWQLAGIVARLPEGSLSAGRGQSVLGDAALGWLLAQHRFDRYRESPEPARLAGVAVRRSGADRFHRACWPRRYRPGPRSGRYAQRSDHGPGRALLR